MSANKIVLTQNETKTDCGLWTVTLNHPHHRDSKHRHCPVQGSVMGRKDICWGSTWDTACAAEEKKSYCLTAAAMTPSAIVSFMCFPKHRRNTTNIITIKTYIRPLLTSNPDDQKSTMSNHVFEKHMQMAVNPTPIDGRMSSFEHDLVLSML